MDTIEVPASLTTLLGGESVKVKFRNGNEQELFVRALPLRLISKWAELDANGTPESEAQLVELYCAADAGIADELTIESHEAVLAKGEELNRPIFARWQSRAASRAREWVAAGEAVQALNRELNPNAALPTSQPNSASSSDGSLPK
jgi:hypothetical protein